MPRKKNRGQQNFIPTYQAPTRTRRWKMASYIRLSKEDLQKIRKGLDCSNSVKNQRDILNYFYETHAEEFESIREYVDDGHTGTDTDREHFQEMLSDIMSGKINCVVVKDLSRLGRNYIEVGKLTEEFFLFRSSGTPSMLFSPYRPVFAFAITCLSRWASASFLLRKTWTAIWTRTAFPILRSPSPT